MRYLLTFSKEKKKRVMQIAKHLLEIYKNC